MKTVAFQIQKNPQNGQFFPIVEGLEGYICDYLTDPDDLLYPVINFLREFIGVSGFDFQKQRFIFVKIDKTIAEHKLACLKAQHEKNKIELLGKNYKNYSLQSQYEPMLLPQPTLGLAFDLKRASDFDPLAIMMSPEKNKLYFFSGFAVDTTAKFGKKNKADAISIPLFLYLWEWWQIQKKQNFNQQEGQLQLPNFNNFNFANKNLTQLIFSFLKEEAELIKKIFQPQQFEYQLIEQFGQFFEKKNIQITKKIEQLKTHFISLSSSFYG